LKLFDIFSVPVWRSGPDAKCDYFNRAWLDFTGRTLEQEIGDGWTKGIHPDDFDACLGDYLRAFAASESFVLEYRLRRHYGEYRWVVIRALRSGASGYMLKDAATVELELVIKSVALGKTYLSPSISHTAIESYLRRVGGESRPFEQLTSRQREILQLIAEGKNTKGIASMLEISVKTVEAHRLQLMARLDIHDVPGLVRYAIRTGMVDA
jgi:DNA-binding CsgD family transcriptional regulator